VCLDVFIDAVCGRVDRQSWDVEYEHHVRFGHVASCHHGPDQRSGLRLTPQPTSHRGLARILNDLMNNPDLAAR
jgi:hypothetical protein